MAELPAGTLTLLFTDIESSTRLLYELGDSYGAVLDQHRQLLRAACTAHDGVEVDNQGDAMFWVFRRASAAVAAAGEAQIALAAHPWPRDVAVRVRMGIHTGEPVPTAEGYAGIDLHCAARLCSAGHGGQVLLSRVTADLVTHDLPPDVMLRYLGEYRLKDIDNPEAIFQLDHPDRPAGFPPLRTAQARPSNLPLQLSSFVGRVQELAATRELLRKSRLVTLIGAGGIGKTRLALQVAAELLDDYPDGVYRVELAPIADPAMVPTAVASAIGVHEEAGLPLQQMLTAYLEPRSMLLILDNCEHLVAACADLVEMLLRFCPRLTILATSREVLGVEGETIYGVPPLALPDVRHRTPVDDLAQYAAVRLFGDRATAVRPSFSLTDRNAEAVTQICRRLDGIPLAIELAAARMRALTAEQIAARLDDRFRLLAGGHRTAIARHQTLRTALDWSYELLDEPERILFRRLSVFAGGWTLEAAEAICAVDGVDASDVLDLLMRLVDKSLVLADEFQERERYHLLDSIRQYAGERLVAAAEATAMGHLHADWFLSLAERAEPELWGRDEDRWIDLLEIEHDNLSAALAVGAAGPETAEHLLRMAGALSRFWEVRGHLSEGRQWLERAMEQVESAPLADRARALCGAGVLARHQGDYDAALRLLEGALGGYRQLGDNHGAAVALLHMGAVARRLGDFTRAAALLDESLSLRRQLGDRREIAQSLTALRVLARDQEWYKQAEQLFEESLPTFEDLGAKQGQAIAPTNLGAVAMRQSQMPRAQERFERALALCSASHDRQGIALSLLDLAAVVAWQGEWTLSTRLLAAADGIMDAIAARFGPADLKIYQECLATLRATMDESEFSLAWASGRALTPEEAVAEALQNEAVP